MRGKDHFILGMRVDATSYSMATQQVLDWARAGQSRCVCVANVHVVMEAHDDPAFRAYINAADLITPDGMPLVWMLRRLGVRDQQRVYGPELTLWVAKAATQAGLPIGLYGGSPQANDGLARSLQEHFPGLRIAYRYSPPFRPLSDKEDAQVVDAINTSGTRILLVGLGCPKQERWMAEHRGLIAAVMLGIGAAFDFHSGLKPQAPYWMQQAGLEWLFRLINEPRRLWRRYLYYNPRFVWLALLQLIRDSFEKN